MRHALMAALGAEVGVEAASEAMAYSWEHWDRVGGMENPGGYLYRVRAAGDGKAKLISDFAGGLEFNTSVWRTSPGGEGT